MVKWWNKRGSPHPMTSWSKVAEARHWWKKEAYKNNMRLLKYSYKKLKNVIIMSNLHLLTMNAFYKLLTNFLTMEPKFYIPSCDSHKGLNDSFAEHFNDNIVKTRQDLDKQNKHLQQEKNRFKHSNNHMYRWWRSLTQWMKKVLEM